MSQTRFKVYGVHLVARLIPEDSVEIQVVCPRGGLVRYGLVVARGDGMDPAAGRNRELPPLGSAVVFEDDPEDGPGHEIAIDEFTYRIITVDDVLLAVIPPPV